jgi:hypothetical protein
MEHVAWTLVRLGLWGGILLAAAGIGHVLLRRNTFASTIEQAVFTLALGLGTSGVIIFLLGLAGLMYTGVFIAITIPWTIVAVVSLAREFKVRRIRESLTRLRASSPSAVAFKAILFAAGFGYWLCLLATTQYPPTGWDSTDEHLVVAREFLAAHRPVALPGIIEPVLPNLNHVLFAWGMALKEDIIAQMIEHTFLMLIAIGLYAWGRRRGSPSFGLALAAFSLGSPLVLFLSESAYVDLCLVAFAFLGVYALRIFWETRDTRWWYLAMALCGMAAGSKLAGLFFAAAGMLTGLLACGLWRERGNLKNGAPREPPQDQPRPMNLTAVAAGWAICLVVIAPWYGFIFFHTGNPVWPAFAHFSRGVWASPELVQAMGRLVSHAPEPRTLTSFLMLPLNWFTAPASFGIGIPTPLNPLTIVWPLAWVIAVWSREVRWWAVWALIFTLYWFFTAQQLRYWLPALPLCGVALFESLRWIIKRTGTVKWSPTVYLLFAVFSVCWGGRYVVPILMARGLPPVTADGRERYLSRLGGYDAVAYINRHAKQDDVVALVYGTWLNYHLKPRVLDLFGFLQIGRFPSYHWPEDEQWVRWLESHNARWILIVHYGAPDYLKIPKEDPKVHPFWPDYELVYSRFGCWIFLHKPVPPDIERSSDGSLRHAAVH